MAKNEVKIVLVPEKRYRELYRAQILLEILQDYRNAHSDYDFERLALTLIEKQPAAPAPEEAEDA